MSVCDPPKVRASNSSPVAKSTSWLRLISIFDACNASRGNAASFSASCRADSINCPFSTTIMTKPDARDCCAVIGSPVKIISFALATPIKRASLCVPPPPGKAPILIPADQSERSQKRYENPPMPARSRRKRPTGDRCDHRLRERFDLIEKDLKFACMLVSRLSAAGSLYLADVCARAKDFIATGYDDRAYPRFARKIMEHRLHLHPHLRIERIFLLRPV